MIENFKELYKRTDNPLLRDQTLGTLLQLKEKSVTYTDIEIQHSKNKKYKANKEDYNGRGELYTILFETWKNGILRLNKQQLARLKEKGSYDGNIYELFDYLKILEEIAKEKPEIIKRTNKPPMMTGYIDNWIGYASDPQNEDSYNNVVARVVDDALKEVRRNYPNYPLRSQMMLLGDSITRKMQRYGYDSQNICFNSKIREKALDER